MEYKWDRCQLEYTTRNLVHPAHFYALSRLNGLPDVLTVSEEV